MPRLGALLELAREHHTALVLARDCGRVNHETLATLLQRIHAHHDEILARHFAEEERLVVLAVEQVPADMAERFHADHAWLRAWRAITAPTIEHVAEYGRRLGAHVRFEERELWPLLQDVALDTDEAAPS